MEEYNKLKKVFNALNEDKSHFVNSNDICTPMECVEEMLDKVPKDFWAKKKIKILDPCAGNGNFHLCIKYLLSKHHQETSDILYFNEINEKRISNIRKYFDNPNITCIDFLAYPEEEKYDMVVANPPYAKFDINGVRTAKNHNLSRDFINKGLSVLKDNGYLIFIIPDNWMSLSDRNDVPYNLSQYQFIHLNIHGAKRYFPTVGSSFTWFVLQKSSNKKEFFIENNFLIKSVDSVKIDAGVRNIPLLFNKIVKSIINKTLYSTEHKKFEVLTTSNLHRYTKKRFLSTEKNGEFKHKIIHTPNQTVWSKVPHIFQDGWKVFIALTTYYGTFVNNCGMTQSIAFIKTENKEQAEKYSAILEHPLYVFLNNIHRYGNFNNIRILQKFPMPNKDNIWDSFNITVKEQKYINEILS